MLRNSTALGLDPHHEACDVLQEQQRNVPLIAQLDEMRSLERGLREQHAIVPQDPDGIAMHARKPRHQCRSELRLELLARAAVGDACDH